MEKKMQNKKNHKKCKIKMDLWRKNIQKNFKWKIKKY